MAEHKGFVAYPSLPPELGTIIRDAVTLANHDPLLTYQTWEHSDIAGRPLTDPIHFGIEQADVLVADVTRLNFNVTYEVGFAIGLQRRLLLIKNSAIAGDDDLVRQTGIFDTLGYETYSGPESLLTILQRTLDLTPLKFEPEPDRKAPAYILETPVRTDEMTRIVARVKLARLFYRSFTPSEDPRLSAVDALRHVARSIGVLIPLLSPEFKDAKVHNLRAAFLAGLAHGMDKITLVLQDGRHPVPLDLRDAAESYFGLAEINRHVQTFATEVYERLQKADDTPRGPRSLLQKTSLGDPLAENEFQSLAAYYVQTEEYHRALRGEVNLVVGRKGTGKTALFFQVRDRVRRDKQNVVIDLKPEGYQLLKLKEHVLDLLSEGAKIHLITAFWEYLLLLEICRKVLEKDRSRSRFDSSLSAMYGQLQSLIGGSEAQQALESDFSERLLHLSQDIIDRYSKHYGLAVEVRLSTNEITNLLHSTTIAELRQALAEYLGRKGQVLVLFDNLDKGWSFKGVESGDILILRCLIDAARKVQQEMRRANVPVTCIVFVRNDIYDLLMASTPDFGKETKAALDWRDPDLLREVLRRRLLQDGDESLSFEQAWSRFCVSHYEGEETSQFFISRSLMRPRQLLKLVGYCRSFAVNLDHRRIETEDITKGLYRYSSDLVQEADRELSDAEPTTSGLLYQFMSEPSEFSEEVLHLHLGIHGVPDDKLASVVEFLLYSGFLGVMLLGEEPRYIWDFGYKLEILRALHRKSKKRSRFVLNPAFWPALEVRIN